MSPPVLPDMTAAQPTPAVPQDRLHTIWGTAVKALHAGQGITARDLDAFVQDETNGQIPSFQALSHTIMAHQYVKEGQELQDIQTPSRGTAVAENLANGFALGIPEKLGNLRPDDPDFGPVSNLLALSDEAHPMASMLSRMGGEMVPSTIAGMATAAPAALARFMPGGLIGKMLLQGGAQGAVGSGLNTYAESPDLVPHPSEILPSMGFGAALGAPFGALAGWQALKLDPAPHLLGRAVQESAPTAMPSEHAGMEAIRGGETTPMRVGPPRLGLLHTPISETANAQLPEALRVMNLEKSPALRSFAAKEIAKSAEGVAQMERGISTRVSMVREAINQITSDPQGGYDAVLNGQKITDPDAIKIAQKHGLGGDLPAGGKITAVDARAIFELEKDLSQSAKSTALAKKGGTASVSPAQLRAARFARADAATLRAALQNVPGFQDLQARVAPYLSREQELLALRGSIIGRTIKPLGTPTAKVPRGGVMDEGVPESLGYTKEQIHDRAMRMLVRPLLSTDIGDIVSAIHRSPEPQAIPNVLRAAPAAGGTPSGQRVRKFGGIGLLLKGVDSQP